MAKQKKRNKSFTGGYREYKALYYEKARKRAVAKMTYSMKQRKRELLKEKAQIQAGRSLTKEEKKYFREEIAKNTLNKKNRELIKREAKNLKKRELDSILRGGLLSKVEFEAYKQSVLEETAEKDISKLRKPKNWLARMAVEEQAYVMSRKQYRTYLKLYKEEQEQKKRERELDLELESFDYDEDGEITYYEEDEGIFISDLLEKVDEEILRSGDIYTQEDLINFDKLLIKYHDLKDEYLAQGLSQHEASEQARRDISNQYFGSQ